MGNSFPIPFKPKSDFEETSHHCGVAPFPVKKGLMRLICHAKHYPLIEQDKKSLAFKTKVPCLADLSHGGSLQEPQEVRN